MWRSLAVLVATGLIALPAAQADDVELPNLTALPPDSVHIDLADESTGLFAGPPRLALRFATTAANRGGRPLDLLGAPRPTAERPTALLAEQCVEWIESVCGRRHPVGVLDWHQPHLHWHFERFAVHELRRLTIGGAPDLSADGLVASSAKASFCLEDVEPDRSEDAASGPATAAYSGCAGLRQGVSPGWVDRYGSWTPGQELPLDGVADGRYALVVTIDPDGLLRETTKTDNMAWALIEISDEGGSAAVVGSENERTTTDQQEGQHP